MSDGCAKALSKAAREAISNDPLGLLQEDVRVKSNDASKPPLVRHFEQIQAFAAEHGREPQLTSLNMVELQLASALAGIRADESKCNELREIDSAGLLAPERCNERRGQEQTVVDPLGLLDDSADDSIFELRNVRKSPRINPATIQRRKRCVNFADYQAGFENIKKDLREGRRTRIVFSEKDLVPGRYYCLNGILMYFESMEAVDRDFSFASGDRTRLDGPVHVVFDNETESNMLYRSLYKALAIPGEGFSISQPLELGNIPAVDSDDKLLGHLYVLRSLSTNPQIATIENLFKIGYSDNSVEERVKNAEHESTYLRAPVRILRDIEVYNVDAHDFEAKVHALFRMSNPSFTVLGEDGKQHYPKEWFIAPLSIIDRAIELIASGQGDGYYYDPQIRDIIHI